MQKSELDLFAMPPTLTTMEDGTYVDYRPIAAITDHGPIKFFLPGNEERYLDLNDTFLHIKARIARADGAGFAVADQGPPVVVADRPLPANLWLHSLFSQLDISLNNTRITSSTDTYPYRAVLETILGHDASAKQHKLESELFYVERGGTMEAWISETNEKRYAHCGQGEVVDMMGQLHSAIFHQEKYLLNGVDLKISLTRSKSNFNLMGTGSLYKVVVQSTKLYLRQVNVSTTEPIETRLSKGENAKYPIRRVLISTFIIPTVSRTLNKDNLFVGGNQLPKRMIINMVDI
jgi:hypothetical protein